MIVGIEIHVSDYCNRSCSFCTFKNVKSDKKMSFDTAINVFEKYKDKTQTVTFSGGGEPTTNNSILRLLIDDFTWHSVKCGLITNGFQTAENAIPLDWVRLSVYSPKCSKEIENVMRTNAFAHNAAFFYRGLKDVERYKFLLDIFDEVTVKTLNESARLSDDECKAILDMGFKCKQNPVANDFAACVYGKTTIGIDGKEYRCCLTKAQGGFFGVEKCPVPCIMYNSNKQGIIVKNKYGFPI